MIVPLLAVIMIVGGVRLEELRTHWSWSVLVVWHEYDEGQQVACVSVLPSRLVRLEHAI